MSMVAFAAAIVLSRKILSCKSCALERSWMRKKASTSAAAPARSPMAEPVAQPSSLACVNAYTSSISTLDTAAEQVGQPAAEQEHATEQDRVGGDHPLQALLREVKIGLDRRQRYVHDRDVEDDHELRCDDQGEGGTAGAFPRSWDRGKCHLTPL